MSFLPSDSLYNGCAEAINDIYGGGLIETTRPWLEVNGTGYYSGVWNVIKIGCDVFMVVGAVLAVIYLIINLADKSITQGNSLETFMKTFIEFILALLLITNSFAIVEFASNIGSSIIDDISMILSTAVQDPQGASSVLMAELNELNAKESDLGRYFGLLGFYIFKLFIPALLARIGQVLIVIACMSRGISIIVYGVFLPIPVADVFKDGINSKGFRYIKKLIALFIQGGIILLIMTVSQTLQLSVTQNAGTALGILYSVGVIFTSVMMIFKSQSFANDIIGV